ncbi:FAD-dependent monooxygenase [Patulibacter americanus]|uniref:FAD-dependent monooxygenase n=1 Tax=Patulibacter americanus TaxID=588672 RepID=UPI0003B3AB82|nr:FAD-dependent monooxygenase [Patulibacter americanus]
MSGAAPDPVVVVGLGPVGATVALLLAGQGVRVVAVERDEAVYPHPRAVALDDDALRVLHAAGALDGLSLRAGDTVRLRGADGGPLVVLPPPPTTTGHPALAFFRQPELERLLRARLAVEPLVEVRLGVEVAAVRQDGRGATLTVRAADGGGGEETVRASYVLACDGGRSAIRRGLGIRLVGRTSGQRWLVVDTAAPVPPRAPVASAVAGPAQAGVAPTAPGSAPAPAAFAPEDFEFVCDPRRPWVHGPLPGGEHRWEFLLGPGEDAAAIERSGVVADLLSARLGGPAPAVRRAAVYVFHARVAARWRVGRILLLGDAAHLAPPFAGQGLGAGLRDAHNLAWKVAVVVRDEAAAGVLDSYAAERRPHVVRMTVLAEALGAVVQLRRRRAARVRDGVMRALARRAGVQAWVARGGWKPPSAIRRGLVASGAHGWRAGEPLPQGPGAPPVGPGWSWAGGDASAVAASSSPPASPVWPGSTDAVTAAWLAPAHAALVRPDGVVFGTAERGGEDALRRAAEAALGGPLAGLAPPPDGARAAGRPGPPGVTPPRTPR